MRQQLINWGRADMQELLERILIGRSDRQTIAKYAKGADRYLGLLTITAAALLGMALASPFATLDNFYGLSGQYSFVTAALELLKSGGGVYALGILLLFVALPIFSISTAFDLWYKYSLQAEKFERVSARAVTCGRLWFFVMLAAIALVYYAKTANTENILHLAVYYLLVSVMLQKIILTRLSRLASTVQFVDD